MSPSANDCIALQGLLKAPRPRVWKALTEAPEFGSWFGVDLREPFRVGFPNRGRVTNEGYQHVVWAVTVTALEPERVFAWTWHPYAIEAGRDYGGETPTLVTFFLQDAPEGTRLTIVEAGFDQVPAARREEAYRMNEQGWAWQMNALARHLAQ
jgi:uncharacterized protein YndB with AHSA1/START domain